MKQRQATHMFTNNLILIQSKPKFKMIGPDQSVTIIMNVSPKVSQHVGLLTFIIDLYH